jgi:hypothetical protein
MADVKRYPQEVEQQSSSGAEPQRQLRRGPIVTPFDAPECELSEIDFGEWKRKHGTERRKNGSGEKIQEVHALKKKKKREVHGYVADDQRT